MTEGTRLLPTSFAVPPRGDTIEPCRGVGVTTVVPWTEVHGQWCMIWVPLSPLAQLGRYETAWTAGLQLCECDIAVTADEHIVLAHDSSYHRMSLLCVPPPSRDPRVYVWVVGRARVCACVCACVCMCACVRVCRV